MRNLMLGSSAAADVAVELSQLSWALKLLICDGEVTGSVLREPRATLLAEDFIRQIRRNAKNPTTVLSVEVRK